MKKIILIGSLFFALPALSADVRVGLQLGKSNTATPALPDNLPGQNTAIVTSKDSDTSWAIELNYSWGDNKESWKRKGYWLLGYSDLGEGSASIRGDSLTPEQYHQALAEVTPILGAGWLVGAGYELVQKQAWSLVADAGIFSWENTIKSSANNRTLKSEQKGNDVFIGTKLIYQLDSRWALQAAVRQYQLPEPVTDFSVGARLAF